MAEKFVSDAASYLCGSNTLEIGSKSRDWLLRLRRSVQQAISFHNDVNLDVDSASLSLISALTSAHANNDSECKSDIGVSSVENVAKEANYNGLIAGCVLKQKSSGMRNGQPSGVRLLPRRPTVLLGRILGSPSSTVPSEHVGALYFEDSSGVVVCEVPSSCSLSWLDSLVVIRHWIYVPKPNFALNLLRRNGGSSLPFGYLEISDCVCLGSQIKKSLSVPRLSQHRSSSCSVGTVSGMCRSVSPVCCNAGRAAFFVIKFADLETSEVLRIIVQHNSLLHLSQLLQLNRVYTITQLCKVKVNLKDQPGELLWSLCPDSTVIERPDYFRSAIVSKKRKGASILPYPKRRLVGDEECGHSSMTTSHRKTDDCPFVSRQDMIVACINAEAGIYELDSGIKLYTCHYSNVHYGRGLRVGAIVQLDNAHQVRHGHSVLGLFCCQFTQLKIVDFSPFDAPYEPLLVNLSVYFKHLPNMSPLQFLWYVEAMQIIEKNLALTRTEVVGESRFYESQREKRCKMKKGVVDSLYAALMSSSSDQLGCNAFEEVFSDPHVCNVSTSRPIPPQVGSVKELLENCSKLKPGMTSESNEKVYLGIFTVDSKGKVRLRDSTGIIDVATATHGDGDDAHRSSSYLKIAHLDDVWMVRPHLGLARSATKDDVPFALIDMRKSRRVFTKPKGASLASKSSCCKCTRESKLKIRLRLTTKSAPLSPLNTFTASFNFFGRRNSVQHLVVEIRSLYLHGLLRIDSHYSLSGICESCLDKHLTGRIFQPLAFDSNHMRLVDDGDERTRRSNGVLPGSSLKRVVDVLDDQLNSLFSFAGFVVSHAITNDAVEMTVRDAMGPDDVRVYFHVDQCRVPFGIVIGVKVAVLNVNRRVARNTGRVYCVANATTVVEILEFGGGGGRDRRCELEGDAVSLESFAGAERVQLGDFSYDAAGNPQVRHISAVQCCITACQRACFKWICGDCRQVLYGRDCSKKCKGEPQFIAEAKCIVDDGTGEALAFAFDSVVASLLGLSSLEWSGLMALVKSKGETVYRRNWHGGDYQQKITGVVDKYCTSRSIRRRVLLFCTQVSTKTPGIIERTVGHGGRQYKTLVSSQTLLKVIRLTGVDERKEALRLLGPLGRLFKK